MKENNGDNSYPAWIPDGYNELMQTVSDDRVSIIYENNEGYLLSFTYAKNRESVSVYSEYQKTDVQTVMVGDKVADLYLDQREGNTSTLNLNSNQANTPIVTKKCVLVAYEKVCIMTITESASYLNT